MNFPKFKKQISVKDILNKLDKPYCKNDNHFLLKYFKFTKNLPLKRNKVIIISDREERKLDRIGYLTVCCPFCNYEKTAAIFDYDEDNSQTAFGAYIYNNVKMDKLRRGFIFHMESKVRLSGCKRHMEMIESLFGQDYANHYLNLWLKKSLYVSKQIKEYLKK